MINTLRYKAPLGTIITRGAEELTSSAKPQFSFSFSEINYTNTSKTKRAEDGSTWSNLTDSDIQEIETFVSQVVLDTSLSARQTANYLAEEYLNRTDWYVIREMELGTPIPAEIVSTRETKRASIEASSEFNNTPPNMVA